MRGIVKGIAKVVGGAIAIGAAVCGALAGVNVVSDGMKDLGAGDVLGIDPQQQLPIEPRRRANG